MLGPKLGEGAGSEVFAWGDDRVVKLFKDGVDERTIQYEAWVTRTAFGSGAPVPEVHDVVEVDGRSGIVFPRYDGQTLLKTAMEGSISAPAAGAIMARLHHSLHAPRYQPPLITFRQWILLQVHNLSVCAATDARAACKVLQCNRVFCCSAVSSARGFP